MPSQLDFQEIAAFVDDSVFTQLSAKLGDAKEGNEGALEKKPLRIDEYLKKYRDAGLRVSQKEFKGCLEVKIRIVYEHPDVTVDLAETITVKTVEDLLAKFVPEATPKLNEKQVNRIAAAFTKGPYIGAAHDDLAEYLRDCWKEYNPAKYKAPCVAVVQSSKSRMVRELAVKARDSALNMKVLYMCARVHRSTGFPPKATNQLRRWLFDHISTVEDIASRLKAVYLYANKHWADVQTEWLELFTDAVADGSVAQLLQGTVEAETRKTKSGSENTSIAKNPNGKMVVLVIDEARCLLPEAGSERNHLRTLQQALKSANQNIGPDGGVFGVLIDTSPRISDPPPPLLLLNPSSRRYGGAGLASFAPLVLASTMDAHWQAYCKADAVGDNDEDEEERQERAEIAP